MMTSNNLITFALVLKTGGEYYDYKYVNNIVDGIISNTTVPYRIVCLTDDKRGLSSDIDEIIRFRHNWPKWWGKIELFRPDIFQDGQVFFLDLDTFIVGNLDELVSYRGEFCALRDFYNQDVMGSGVMSWHGSRVTRIYEAFCKNPEHFIHIHKIGGDQEFIRQEKPSIEYFQDVFPNQVISYKIHYNAPDGELPNNSRVLCFHGTPKPHEITSNLKSYWKQ